MGFTPGLQVSVVYAERGRALVEIRPTSMEQFLTLMNDYVLNARNTGERFHIDYKDEEFGQLEIRNYKVLKGEIPALQFAVSYPAGINASTTGGNYSKGASRYGGTSGGQYGSGAV